MPRANVMSLLGKHPSDGWAVGCFAVYNLEFIRAVTDAAEIEAAPAILSLDAEDSSRRGLEALAAAALHAAGRASVPIAVHLNHAKRFDFLLAALDAGLDSLMFDGSALPLEENIDLTQKAAHLVHEGGGVIEGEVGVLNGPEDITVFRRFVRETEVDSLAVTLSPRGPAWEPLVRELVRELPAPLVLHNGSVLGEAGLKQAVRAGIRKVNVHTELFSVFTQAVCRDMDSGQGCSLAALESGVDALTSCVRNRLRLLGSSGRAGAS
ncbi:MAG: class II fructose-bisphosphate aldolase [Desulfovibrio aminophilus]|uniref:class II fructose-bisphosphate aldolase n=1 Tax=Desulfovibrio aminophilus TaxID=81425 RepID=UPI0039ED24CC